MSVFDEAKKITALEAAERYAGVKAQGTGDRVKACCPLHNEKTPSCVFYADGTFCCFGCHAGGTSIDLTAKLFGLTPYQAAYKVCEDFGLPLPAAKPTRKPPVKLESDNRPPRKEIDAAVTWLDTQVVRYIRWCTAALASLTEDTDEQDNARALFLREREKAQRLADELLEAFQESKSNDADVRAANEKKLEQLLIDNVAWAKDIEEQLEIWKRANAPEVIE